MERSPSSEWVQHGLGGPLPGDLSGTALTETSRRREGFELHDLKHNDRKNMFGNVKFQLLFLFYFILKQ